MAKPSRIITVEEHFNMFEFAGLAAHLDADLRDITGKRLERMDQRGVDMQVLSFISPGIQSPMAADEAERQAKRVNDALAAVVAAHPRRFAGLAALPMQDPRRAADELERCVKQLRFGGALLNGHIGGHYLDEPQFFPLWERAEALGVPIYLHPAPPRQPWATLDGYPELAMAAWGWAAETSAHALRMVCSGLFDRFPKATLVLGHMGELIPFQFARLDNRWSVTAEKKPVKKMPSDYFRSNIVISTSGTFSDVALKCAIAEMGADRVMFAIDYPFEDINVGMDWFDKLALDGPTIEAFAHGNAERVFGLNKR